MKKLVSAVALIGAVLATSAAQAYTTDFGIVPNSEAAEYYTLHRGSAAGQLDLPVAVQRDEPAGLCTYTAYYKDEDGVRVLATVTWATHSDPGRECPRDPSVNYTS